MQISSVLVIQLYLYSVWADDHSVLNNEIVNFITHLIADDENGSTKIERKILMDGHLLTPSNVGNAIDSFLTTRPWWWVEKEPYRWNNVNHTREFDIILRRFEKVWDPVFNLLISSQYPADCHTVPLRAARTGGFDSFGNNFYNYVGAKTHFPSAIVTPYIRGSGVSFLDDHYCPHTKNRYECAFLPATNCPMPEALLNETERSDGFTFAGRLAENLPDQKFRQYMSKFSNRQINSPAVSGMKSSGLYKGKAHTHPTSTSPFGLFYGYALLFRPNHHFRSLVAHTISEWKAKQITPFPENGDCVAVVIRRGLDRSAGGNSTMYEWCEKHKIHPDGSCLNDATGKIERHGDCVHYLDYGCQTGMPYGEMTLAHVLNASRIVSTSKNVLVRCDDPLWLEEQVKVTPTDLTLFLSTPPAHTVHDIYKNKKKSTAGGVSYMAAIKLASMCSALVGHSGSAVTAFFHNNMCVRHSDKVGVCPHLYDFNGG